MKRTVKELQHLAAAMAHEVRNPLNSMAIHVELLEGRLKREGAPPEALKSLGVLAQEIERVDGILEQYLTYAGPSEATRAPVDASKLLATAVERLRPLAEKRGVKLELVAEGLGRWPVDGDGVTDAVVAVAESAIVATGRGRSVSITARSDVEGQQAEIAICDGAEPIGDAEAAKLFHMGSKRSHGGVGLTVARQIVKGNGGSLGFKRGEAGNVITIRLPL